MFSGDQLGCHRFCVRSLTHFTLAFVVLQLRTEAIQEAIQSIGRVTRSVAANSPKLAPPSLFAVDKTPNRKMGNWNFLFFFVVSPNINMQPFVLSERLCHFPVVAEKQQSARK